MPAETAHVPLLALLVAYLELAQHSESASADARMGTIELLLAEGEILTEDDLFAKARYVQACGRTDPALIPMEALDTLVVGVVRVLGSGLSSTAHQFAQAA